MGGAAFLIRGELDYGKHECKPQKKTFLQRLRLRRQPEGPKILEFGQGKLIDVPAEKLSGMSAAFREYLHNRIPKPWSSTNVFHEYLDAGVIGTYVRGEQPADSSSTDWYVQMTFSGCAGLGEIAAELGAHWAERWYQDEGDFITTSFLEPFHFTPGPSRSEDHFKRAFLPLGHLGYGLYVGHLKDQQYPPEYAFELDAGATEYMKYEDYLRLIKEIDETFEPVMSDGLCRCQLCMPDFDAASVEGRLKALLNQP